MPAILVSGLINIETTVRVDAFPIAYEPVRYPFFGVQSSVSGVGFNIARALTVLGNQVRLASLIGGDAQAARVRAALAGQDIRDEFVLSALEQTPESVILYDAGGRRMINVDLKDIQERVYPADAIEQALRHCDLAVLCNVNFSRPYLRLARERGLPVATDVHAIADLDDDYNRDFMAAADILFMSDERLPCAADLWARQVQERFGAGIVVVGLGAEGALLAVKEDNVVLRVPAVSTRPVLNTIGAGDALFSAFLHGYLRTGDPYQALRRAVVFACYKIGATGAAEGFLDEEGLSHWCWQVYEQGA